MNKVVVRRVAGGLDLAVFLIAMLAIAVVANYFAHRPGLRVAFDATKTRAYSLSARTMKLIDQLSGEWTIALVMVEERADAATRQQVDQVLSRYEEASDEISVMRVDPTRPASFEAYDALLSRLRALEAEPIAAYERALDEGVDGFVALQLFAEQQAGQLEQVLDLLGAGDPMRREVQQFLGVLGLLPQEGGRILEAVGDARRVNDAQPIPDYETARSILAVALNRYADELSEIARLYSNWRDRDDVSALLTQFAASVRVSHERLAQRLVALADPLARLPVLEVSRIGRELQDGEVLVIIGPERTAVVPSAQLFPTNRRTIGDVAVAFDRRFRGEQVISAAIRSLLVPRMPMVVFMHADEESLLREQPQRIDLVAIGSLLVSSRFSVREWHVTRGERPVPADGQPVVWVVLPPLRRQGVEAGADEIVLIRQTERLIADGAAVCLTVNPSLLPRYRQADPWQRVAAPFGLRPDTQHVVYEAPRAGKSDPAYQRRQVVQRFSADHPISAALNGQATAFGLPVPIEIITDGRGNVTAEAVATIEASPRRWLEKDWESKLTVESEVERGVPLGGAAAVVVAAERRSPVGTGTQRFILVGSVEWLRSFIADAVTPIGGGRVALLYPGNQELAQASVAWLAGMDALIAPGPVSQQVARLDGLDARSTLIWALIAMVGTPLGALAFGVVFWLFREV